MVIAGTRSSNDGRYLAWIGSKWSYSTQVLPHLISKGHILKTNNPTPDSLPAFGIPNGYLRVQHFSD